jgi:hypothetical protein
MHMIVPAGAFLLSPSGEDVIQVLSPQKGLALQEILIAEGFEIIPKLLQRVPKAGVHLFFSDDLEVAIALPGHDSPPGVDVLDLHPDSLPLAQDGHLIAHEAFVRYLSGGFSMVEDGIGVLLPADVHYECPLRP